MKRLLVAGLLIAAGQVRAGEPKGLGLGLVVGDPSGLTGKLFLSPTHAIDAGLGLDGDVDFYVDYLWHGWKAFPQPEKGRLAAYLGLGPSLINDVVALRTVGGASYFVAGPPVEVFAELVPSFRLNSRGGITLEGGIGARYYFSRFN